MEAIDVFLIALRFAGTLALGQLAASLLLNKPKILWTTSFLTGIALNSLVVFWIQAFEASFWILDFVQGAGILLWVFRLRKISKLRLVPNISVSTWHGKAFWCVTGVAVLFLVSLQLKAAFGGWDAFAIWNLKGRLVAGDVAIWQPQVSNLLYYSHPDYPLLLPAAVSMMFLISQDLILWPILLSILFTIGTVFLFPDIWGRDTKKGILAAVALLLTYNYLKMGASQYADMPLAFYLLLGVKCLADALRKEGDQRLFLAAGFFLGACCWTKNEGLLYLLIVLALIAIHCFRKKQISLFPHRLKWIILGSLPFLLALVQLKFLVKTENDIVGSASGESLISKLSDTQRYLSIFEKFFYEMLNFPGTAFSPFILLLLLVIFARLYKWKWNTSLVGINYLVPLVFLSLCGFFAIYLITPHDLQWHLNTSLSRLLLQVYPVFIFAVFEMLPPRILGSPKNGS